MVYDEDVKGVKMGHHKVYFTPAAFTIDGGASKSPARRSPRRRG